MKLLPIILLTYILTAQPLHAAPPLTLDEALSIALEKHSAILVVTHDHRMVEGFDRIFQVSDGRIVGEKKNSEFGSEKMTENRNFNSKAATWDEEPRRVKLAREVAEGIINAVHPTADMDAMDFGCGTGLLTLLLQPHLRAIDGIDTSRGMLDVLEGKIREQGLTNLRPLLCDVEREERPHGPYHLIVSSMTLHHVAEPAQLFRLFYELLLPGGTLCVADLDKEEGTFHDDNTDVQHFGFERHSLKEALADSGFRSLSDQTVAVIEKGSPENTREYPVFLICARKPLYSLTSLSKAEP